MRTDVYPEHLNLYGPWPVPGECDWLGGCTEPATQGGKCDGHKDYLARLALSAARSWALMPACKAVS